MRPRSCARQRLFQKMGPHSPTDAVSLQGDGTIGSAMRGLVRSNSGSAARRARLGSAKVSSAPEVAGGSGAADGSAGGERAAEARPQLRPRPAARAADRLRLRIDSTCRSTPPAAPGAVADGSSNVTGNPEGARRAPAGIYLVFLTPSSLRAYSTEGRGVVIDGSASLLPG